VTHPTVIWLLCDGRAGHENQSLGLAEAIGRRVPCGIHRVNLAEKPGLLGRHRVAIKACRDLPRPDLVIGAGHSTHASLWWLARKTGAKSVVLMRPSLPLGCFDLCIAPAHDFPEGFTRPGLVLTRGALNRVTARAAEKSGKLILVGGPSKTHGWDGDALLEMLAIATDRGGWELTDSRRTPDGFLDQARTHLPGVTVFSHEQTPPDWMPEKLGRAKEVWVTEDSVSMIYEALTSGARVGLLPLPRLKSGARVLNGIDRLLAEKFLTPFAEWRESQRISSPPEILREADRCAEIVLARLTSMDQLQP
jgi:mitochondrial fission protein ELM1